MPDPFTTTTLTIQRMNTSAAQNKFGEVVESFSTAQRGTLPTSVSGRATILKAEQRDAYGIEATRIAWIFRSETNMQCDLRDQIVFTDNDSVSHTVRVVVKTHRRSPSSKVYRTIGEEDGTRA